MTAAPKPRAKLNEAVVKQIRQYAGPGVSVAYLAWQFDVDESTIRKVLKRKTWRHV